MHSKITTEISICQAENGFSLDELVKTLADAFENKAFSDILKMNGGFERRIRTSLGEFKMDFWRVRCSKCGKTQALQLLDMFLQLRAAAIEFLNVKFTQSMQQLFLQQLLLDFSRHSLHIAMGFLLRRQHDLPHLPIVFGAGYCIA